MNTHQMQVINKIDKAATAADLPTYTELRDALRVAMDTLVVVELSKVLPVFTKAGGEL